MRLRFTILIAEGKLFFLLLSELVLLNRAALVLVFEFPLFLLLLWWVTGGLYLKPIGAYLALLLAAVIVRAVQIRPQQPVADIPLCKPLDSFPALRELTLRIASSLHTSPVTTVWMALAPAPWHRHGVDLPRHFYRSNGLPLPVSCLRTWSISELEAHIGRTLVSRRGPSWLIAVVEAAMERIGPEYYQALVHQPTHWSHRMAGNMLRRYLDTFNGWRFLVDIEADVKVAQVLGADPIISLAYKKGFAQTSALAFITTVVESALEKQALVPIAESYEAYASAAEPHWTDAVNEDLKLAARSDASPSSALVGRLAVLSTLPRKIAVEDHRPATNLFLDLQLIERDVAAHEFGQQRVESARAVTLADSLSLVVIPQIQDEVGQNRELLEGKTRFDIPGLLRAKAEIASAYRSNPGLLLARNQREARIPYLLGAFLALELIAQQWEVTYQPAEGIQLIFGKRRIQPFTLVEQLDGGVISELEYLDAVK